MNILKLIGLEKLLLGLLVLLVLALKVAQLSIHLVESVLVILDGRVALTDLLHCLRDLALLVLDQILNALDSLVVVLRFGRQNLNSLGLSFVVFVEIHLDVSEMHQLLVILLTDLGLLAHHLLVVLDLLPQVEVVLVSLVALSSEGCQICLHVGVLVADLLDRVEEADLLFFNVAVFKLGLVELSDESVDLLTVCADTVEVLLLHMLHLDLDLLVLVEQVAVLVFELVDVPTSAFHFGDLSPQFIYEELLVLARALRGKRLSSPESSR